MPEKKRPEAGLLFVACILIGVGIGMAFNRPEIGGCIGTGVGFIVLAFLRGEKEKEEETQTSTLKFKMSGIFFAFLGCLLALIGALILLYPSIDKTTLGAIALVCFGGLFAAWGASLLAQGRGGEGS